MNKFLFAVGLLIVGIDAVLLLMNIVESGVSALIAIVGISLIAASGKSKIRR